LSLRQGAKDRRKGEQVVTGVVKNPKKS